MRTIIISMIIFIAAIATNNPAKAQQKVETQEQVKGKVESSYVCYVNNKYMGKEQIPVEVDGKTYYGCCQGCVGNLQKNRAPRYAKDPLTGKEVDKATAYIVIKEVGKSDVLYFENKANYEKYIKK
tara:strand:- start:7198 stop:7575 length:378 start_codon:yes stop_codon:yes gene_type:complete